MPAEPAATRRRLNAVQRFAIGGLGGLLPVLVSALAADLPSLIDHRADISAGIYVGAAIRVIILIVLGGVVVLLNSEVITPIGLVQLGIAAPALITAYINGSSLTKQTPNAQHTSSIFTSAYAADMHSAIRRQDTGIVRADFFWDITRGLTTNLSVIQSDVARAQVKSVADANAASAKAAQDKAAASASASAAAAATAAKAAQDSAATVAKAARNVDEPTSKAAQDATAITAKAAADANAAAGKAAQDANAASKFTPVFLETKLSFSIIDTIARSCWTVTVKSEDLLDTLRKSFPPPKYDIRSGACPPVF